MALPGSTVADARGLLRDRVPSLPSGKATGSTSASRFPHRHRRHRLLAKLLRNVPERRRRQAACDARAWRDLHWVDAPAVPAGRARLERTGAAHRRVGTFGIWYGALSGHGRDRDVRSAIIHVRAGEWTVDQAAGS